jgi:hypothetical protein
MMFAHLTTSIAQIAVYLYSVPTNRDVPNLEEIQRFMDKSQNERVVEGANVEDPDQVAEMRSVGRYLARFNMDILKFCSKFNKTIKLMKIGFDRGDRMSDDLKTRLLAMSGLSWNAASKNNTRDWGQVAIAATLEPHIIRLYKSEMLRECKGASALRKEIRTYLIGIARRGWCFADNLPHDEDEDEVLDYDPVTLRKKLQTAYEKGPKGKKDPVLALVEMLESCPLLHCSDPSPGVASQTVESLAELCISRLIRVCIERLCSHLRSIGRL